MPKSNDASHKSNEPVVHSVNDAKVTKSLILNTAWLRNQWVIIFGVLLLVSSFGLFVYSRAASVSIATLEAEQMTLTKNSVIIADTTASQGRAVKLSQSSTLSGLVKLPSTAYSLGFVAKAGSCRSMPALSLSVDGKTTASYIKISSRSWKAYSVTTTLTAATHNISIKYIYQYGCGSNLYLDSVTFYGNSSTTPPLKPTVALSASPSSLTAGSSSTLTWTSTNATSCSAAGGWSGPEPVSGSVTTGALNGSTTYTLTCTGGGDSASTSSTATVTPSGTPSGGTGNPASGSNTYGLPLAADSLGNLEIGKASGRIISYRFKASHSGAINTVSIFLIFRAAGYYSGNGGAVRVELQTDDGSTSHLPSGTVLAGHTITDPMSAMFRTINLDSPASLSTGQLYHLVFTNPSSSPTTNWVSIDDIYQNSPGSQMQPSVSDTDLAVVWKYDTAGAWTINRNHTPIYIINYSDGATQGQGYIDALSSSGLQSIGGSNMVEESIVASGASRSVSKVFVRVTKTGSSDLNITINQNGNTIASTTVAASTIGSGSSWVSASLLSAVTLSPSSTYTVVLSSASSSYSVFPVQEGTNYGLIGGNNFTDGQYQFSTNSGSSFQKLNNHSDYDLQLYLQ